MYTKAVDRNINTIFLYEYYHRRYLDGYDEQYAGDQTNVADSDVIEAVRSYGPRIAAAIKRTI